MFHIQTTNLESEIMNMNKVSITDNFEFSTYDFVLSSEGVL